MGDIAGKTGNSIDLIRLNCGNLFTDSYLDTVIRLNDEYKSVKVVSLFGSTAYLTPTARSFDRIPDMSLDDLDSYITKARSHNINIRWTLNNSCIGSIQSFHHYWHTTFKKAIKILHLMGVNEWTITSPLVLSLIRDMYPDDYIEVSTINEVTSLGQALSWGELGASGINISTSINRHFDAITSIANVIPVSILANEFCLLDCIWRRECYNLSSHNSKRGDIYFDSYPFKLCNTIRLNNPVEWVRSMIVLPQRMRDYINLTNTFKLAYRTATFDTAISILTSYMSEEHTGNLCNLWPTISELAKTANPADITYIDTPTYDTYFNYFKQYGKDCKVSKCITCNMCQKIYEDSKR